MGGDNLMLEYLRAIRATLGQHGPLQEQTGYRMSSVGQQVAGERSDFAPDASRADGPDKHLERIERRLDRRDDA